MRKPGTQRRSQWRTLGFAALLLALAAGCPAAEADLLPREMEIEPPPARLNPDAARRADAMAWFAKALFEEESDGPDHALESYRKSLDLDPSNAELALRLSQEYLRRGETVEAISTLKDSLKARPKNTDLSLALAIVYLRHLNKPELAVRYANKALAADASCADAYQVLVEIALTQSQRSRVAGLFDQAYRAQVTDPEFWLNMAELAGRLARTPGAPEVWGTRWEGFLKRAVSHAEEAPAVLARAGDLYALAGRTEDAVHCYERAYQIKASLPDLRKRLAVGFAELDKRPEAIAMFSEIIRLNPLDLSSYDHLTQLYLKEDNISQAAANARQALLLDPQTLDRHVLLVDLLFKMEDFPRAAVALAEARRLFPTEARLSYYHAIALSQAHQHEDALKAFHAAEQQAINVEPALLDADFYFDYGASAERAGRLEEAERFLRKSMTMNPSGAARAYNYLGYSWADRGINLKEAGHLIRKALEMEPGNGAYLDSLGWLQFRQGQFEEALSTLLRAAEHLPEPDATVFEHIGDACQKLGRTSEAILYWKKAVKLDPDNAAIAAKLDDIANAVVRQEAPVRPDRPAVSPAK